MNFIEKIVIAVMLVMVSLSGIGGVATLYTATHQPTHTPALSSGGTEANYIKSFGTSSAVTVTSSDIQVLATSTDRVYCVFSNMDNNAIFLGVNADRAAVAYQGIMINASSSYTIEDKNLYIGAIHAITNSGSARMAVTCK